MARAEPNASRQIALHDRPGGEAVDEDRRLRVLRLLELLLRALPTQLGEGESQHLVRLSEDLTSGGIHLGELEAHSDVLAALPRKQRGEVAHLRSLLTSAAGCRPM